MKKTTTTTTTLNDTNIKNQEEKVMKDELQAKREELIGNIINWYTDSYTLIRDMEQSNYKPWIVSHARELTANARGGDDKRDANREAIMEGIIRYVKELPDDFFEDFESPSDCDEFVEFIYDEFYGYADYELTDIPSRKEEFIEWLRDRADINQLDFGEVEDYEKPALKTKLLERYEDEEEDFFEESWNDDDMSVYELYDYVNEHICNRYDLYEE